MKFNIPIIGILRGIDQELFKAILPLYFDAGFDAIEITMNTRGAERIVTETRNMVPEGKMLGMGTIRNPTEAKRAIEAGAMFLVTPNLNREVISLAKRHQTPIIAGALTPTEVYKAWQAGADMVKVFPCSSIGGAQYIRELRGPFDQIPLVAVGGVSFENLAEYFSAGAAAVGIGGSLFGKKALERRNIAEISAHLKKIIEHYRHIR